MREINASNKMKDNIYELAINEIQDYAIILLDEHGRIQRWNSGAENLKGYTAIEALNQHFSIFYTEESKNNNIPEKLLERAVSHGKVLDEGWRMKKDQSLFWASVLINTIHDEDEKIIGFLKVTKDLTEKRMVESDRELLLERILNQNQRLEQFNYIISHNLRSPVSMILGIIDSFEGDLSLNERTEGIGFLKNAVKQLDNIIYDLNAMLKEKNNYLKEEGEVYFEHIVNSISATLQNLIKINNVVIKTDFTAFPSVKVEKAYLYSIFYNLISNSIKYKAPNRNTEILISSEVEHNQINLSFKDNGSGIDLAKHGNEVFARHKRFHLGIEGTGMGLFMVKTHVELIGGSIKVKSEPGIGSEFIISLPYL